MKLGGRILISLEGCERFFFCHTTGRKRKRGRGGAEKCEADRSKQTTDQLYGNMRAVSDSAGKPSVH